MQAKQRSSVGIVRGGRCSVVTSGSQNMCAGNVRADSRSRAQWNWWTECNVYERAVSKCSDRADLLEFISRSDRRVVNWFALGCSGLRARLVGGARVTLRRASPGCGVHRRRKHGRRCADRLVKCAQSGRAVCLSPDVCDDSGLHGCLKVRECGSRWHGRGAKCLQACIFLT